MKFSCPLMSRFDHCNLAQIIPLRCKTRYQVILLRSCLLYNCHYHQCPFDPFNYDCTITRLSRFNTLIFSVQPCQCSFSIPISIEVLILGNSSTLLSFSTTIAGFCSAWVMVSVSSTCGISESLLFLDQYRFLIHRPFSIFVHIFFMHLFC